MGIGLAKRSLTAWSSTPGGRIEGRNIELVSSRRICRGLFEGQPFDAPSTPRD
jgi:hypothetical protein